MKILFAFIIIAFMAAQTASSEEIELDTLWTKDINDIRDAKFSPDDMYIAAGNGVSLQMMRTSDGVAIWEVFTTGVIDIEFSPNGASVYTAHYDAVIRVWDAMSGEMINTIFDDHPEFDDFYKICNIAITPDGSELFALIYEKYEMTPETKVSLFVFDISSEEVIFREFLKEVTSILEISPDGNYFVVDNWWTTGTMELYYAKTKKYLRFIGYKRNAHSSDADFSPDGKLVASCSGDRSIQVWNLQEQKMRCELQSTGQLWNIEFSYDSKYLFSGSDVWNISNNEFIGSIPYAGTRIINSSHNSPKMLFSHGSKLILFDFNITGVLEDKKENILALKVYPNPNSDMLNIDFNLPYSGEVAVKLTGLCGNVVDKIFDGYMLEGYHSLSYDFCCGAAGVYFIVVEGMGFSSFYKLLKE